MRTTSWRERGEKRDRAIRTGDTQLFLTATFLRRGCFQDRMIWPAFTVML
jgi:hypothetical protein